MKIKGLQLHPGQVRIKDEILASPAKFHMLNSSRQAGKTTLLEQLLLYYSINKPKITCLWVAPVYTITKKSFDNILNNLFDSGIIKEYYKADHTITFLNDSQLIFRSSTNYDTIRGGSYEYVFMDEFAFMDENAWLSAIRPTMAVKGKKAIISSTPKGKNLFYQLCMLGRSQDNDNYQYHYMNYKDNPYYDLQEVSDARRTLPEKVFLQEYEAQFIDDGGTIFNNLNECAVIDDWMSPQPGERYFGGLDLGKQVDYTVLTILNSKGEVVYVYRSNQQSWNLIISQILSILNRYKPNLVIEVNSIGDPIYEDIRRKYNRVMPFVTTAKSKEEIIESLILAFNDETISVPSRQLMPEYFNELSLFSFEYNKQLRTIKYGAPVGFNDDCVMSLALAYFAKRTIRTSTFSIIK